MDMGAQTAPIVLGRAFWRALIRGGYQGAVYYLDTLLKPEEKRG
jgi:hypothetical protein